VNKDYIAKHYKKAQSAAANGNQALETDSYWRIASHLDLFGEDLNPSGSLTAEQQAETERYVSEMFSS
jgi:hypothetical protein